MWGRATLVLDVGDKLDDDNDDRTMLLEQLLGGKRRSVLLVKGE